MDLSSCKNVVAIYCRLSKEDLDKDEEKTVSESIKNQKRLLEDYAVSQGWQIYDFYVDDDYSGSDRDRPEFSRMITDAKLSHFNVVLCKKQARFARDIEYIEKYVHGLFVELQIRFVALLDNIDTGAINRSVKKASQISSLVDEWYLADLSDNIISVFDTKRREGEFIGSWAPFGYSKNPENTSKLIIDEPAAEIVREIFELYLNGHGIKRISDLLNDRGTPNPYAHRLKKGEKCGGKGLTSKSMLWSPSTIAQMLDNQTYIGDLIQGKYKKASYKSKKLLRVPEKDWIIVPKSHEPIVDIDTWMAVQEIRKTKVRPQKSGEVSIFSSKLRCLYCEELLNAVNYPKWKNKEKLSTEFNTSYRCSKRILSKTSCAGTTISQTKLEKHVLGEINELSESYFDGEEIEKLLQKTGSSQNKMDFLKKEIARLQSSLSSCELSLKTLYYDKVKGIITEEQFVSLNMQIKKDSEKLMVAIEEAKKELQLQIEKVEKRQNLADLIERYRNLDKLNRQVVTEFIDVIYIGKKDEATGERIIRTVWNF